MLQVKEPIERRSHCPDSPGFNLRVAEAMTQVLQCICRYPHRRSWSQLESYSWRFVELFDLTRCIITIFRSYPYAYHQLEWLSLSTFIRYSFLSLQLFTLHPDLNPIVYPRTMQPVCCSKFFTNTVDLIWNHIVAIIIMMWCLSNHFACPLSRVSDREGGRVIVPGSVPTVYIPPLILSLEVPVHLKPKQWALFCPP